MGDCVSAEDISQALAARAEDVCRFLLPGGRRLANEWKCGSVHGEAGNSLGVRLVGDRAGRWADFGDPEQFSGDLVGLWRAVRNVDAATALREAEEFLGWRQAGETKLTHPRGNGAHATPKPVAEPQRVPQVPPDDAQPDFTHSRYGAPSAIWPYRTADGRVLAYVARFDPPSGARKQILPRTWTELDGWQWKGFADPRPLYGLDLLTLHPDWPVLLVEGEKAADAARRLFTGMVAVTWSGGVPAVSKADWSPLRGRRVTCWPDADDVGIKAMQKAAALIGEPVRMLDPTGQPDGWDVADAVAEGKTAAQMARWCSERASEYVPPVASIEPEANDDLQRYAADADGARELVSEYVPEDVPDMLEGEPEFGEPQDVFESVVVPELKRDYLPPAIVDFVFDQSALIGTDPGIMAVSALVALAAVTDDDNRIQPKKYEYEWTESARVWGAFVADPSTKKSPPMKRATKHLKKMDNALSKHYEESCRAFEEQKSDYEQAKKRTKNDIGPPPEKPKQKCLMVEDTTIESLGVVLKDNPRGLFCMRDELSGWFGQLDAYSKGGGGKDKAFWLECYEGGAGKVNRITREPITIPNKSVCLLGGIQPGPMRKIAGTLEEDGLLQRFMVICPGPASGLGEDREPNRDASNAYESITSWLIGEKGDRDKPVMFTDDARAVLNDIEKAIRTERQSPYCPDRMGYHLGKWSGLFARLCLLYHAIDCANSMVSMKDFREVDVFTAHAVRDFMFEYLLPHMRSFYDDVLEQNPAVSNARWIAGYILAHGCDVLRTRDVASAFRAWRKMQDRERHQTMQMLEMASWIVPVEGRWRGLVAPKFKVNPVVHEVFAERAVAERKRREAEVAKIAKSVKKRTEDKEGEI